MKPKLFIGSSVEGLTLAYATQKNLRRAAEVTVWDQGIFSLSSTALESLIETLNQSDFGLFIFSPDDVAIIRGEKSSVVRDNVIFELGLFIGKLGKNRCFFMKPEDGQDLHLPSDLIGIQPAFYESDRTDGNFQAATAASCHEIRDAITKLGLSSRTTAPIPEQPEVEKTAKEKTDDEELSVSPAAKTVKNEVISDDSIDTEKNNAQAKVEPKVSDEEKVSEGTESPWFRLYEEDRFEAAIHLLEDEITTEEDQEKILEKKRIIGSIKYFSGDQKWEDFFKNLIKENPEHRGSHTILVQRYIDADLTDSAFQLIETIKEKFPDPAKNALLRADVFKSMGQLDTAIEELQELDEADKSSNLYLRLAQLYKESDQKVKALEMFYQAFLLAPTDKEIIKEFADMLSASEMNEAALHLYQKLCSIDSRNPTYLTLFGNTCLQLNLYDHALTKYEQANKLAGHNKAWIIGNIGNLYSGRGLTTKAEEYLKQAIELNEDSDYAHDRLSSALKDKKTQGNRFDELITIGRKALSEIGKKRSN